MAKKRLIVEIESSFHAIAKSKAYSEGKTLKDKVIELFEKWLGKTEYGKDIKVTK